MRDSFTTLYEPSTRVCVVAFMQRKRCLLSDTESLFVARIVRDMSARTPRRKFAVGLPNVSGFCTFATVGV